VPSIAARGTGPALCCTLYEYRSIAIAETQAQIAAVEEKIAASATDQASQPDQRPFKVVMPTGRVADWSPPAKRRQRRR
jgi:hypothetical protein